MATSASHKNIHRGETGAVVVPKLHERWGAHPEKEGSTIFQSRRDAVYFLVNFSQSTAAGCEV